MKVLVIRYSSLGDIVLASPIFRLLYEQLNAEVHVMTKRSYRILLELNHYIRKVHTLEDSSHSDLKRENYDLVVDLQKNIRSIRLRIALSKKSVSYEKLTFQKWLYLVLGINRLNRSHVADRYINSLRSLGIEDDGRGLEIGRISHQMENHKKGSRKKLIISLGGSYVTKRVPKHIVDYLIMHDEYDFQLIGGSDVEDIYDNDSEYVENLVNKTTLIQSIDLIAQCDIVITGDTGMMHIAAALQKPIVVIWGSTSEDFGFYPYYGSKSEVEYSSVAIGELSCRPCSKYGKSVCPKGHMNCLKLIDGAQVMSEIRRLLK